MAENVPSFISVAKRFKLLEIVWLTSRYKRSYVRKEDIVTNLI